MPSKRISAIIQEKSERVDYKSPLYPKSQTVLNLDVLITKRANELFREMGAEINEFSGTPKIIIQQERTELAFPEHIIAINNPSDQNIALENYVYEQLTREDLSIKLETSKIGGIFKWLSKDEQLLLITLYKVDSTRRKHKNLPHSPFTLKIDRGDRSLGSNSKHVAKLVYRTLLELKSSYRSQFDEAYRRYLDHAFKPFEDFLYNERLSIRDPKFRPKCRYKKREGQ
ncbi:MAG: hypothetical protein ACXAB7_03410, partial [Candidatus Kariarchaeaceae archaeon]